MLDVIWFYYYIYYFDGCVQYWTQENYIRRFFFREMHFARKIQIENLRVIKGIRDPEESWTL